MKKARRGSQTNPEYNRHINDGKALHIWVQGVRRSAWYIVADTVSPQLSGKIKDYNWNYRVLLKVEVKECLNGRLELEVLNIPISWYYKTESYSSPGWPWTSALPASAFPNVSVLGVNRCCPRQVWRVFISLPFQGLVCILFACFHFPSVYKGFIHVDYEWHIVVRGKKSLNLRDGKGLLFSHLKDTIVCSWKW